MVEYGKNMNKLIDCCDLVIFRILRNLIHVFILLGIIGFAYTISLILADDESFTLDEYEIKVAKETSAIQSLMNYHPVVYGIKKGAKKVTDTGMIESMN